MNSYSHGCSYLQKGQTTHQLLQLQDFLSPNRDQDKFPKFSFEIWFHIKNLQRKEAEGKKRFEKLHVPLSALSKQQDTILGVI